VGGGGEKGEERGVIVGQYASKGASAIRHKGRGKFVFEKTKYFLLEDVDKRGGGENPFLT